MPRNESPPSSAADRLNTYLDGLATRGVADWKSLDPSLAATVDYVHGLDDRSAPMPGLMEETWRNLMGTTGVAQGRKSTIGLPTGAVRNWPTMQTPTSQSAARPRWFGGGLAAAVLVIAALVGYSAFRIARPNDGERPTMSAAVQEAATAEASPGPALAGCTVEPRPDGSVVALAGSKPTVMRVLPRLNEDPVHFEQRSASVDGDLFLHDDKPRPSDDAMAGIQATLEELIACRFHVWGANGQRDLDGRYFALFSDDYFRGELAGYREAGMEPDILMPWMPRPGTSMVEARELSDGRVVVRLKTEADRYMLGWRWVVVFIKEGERWIVDEVGQATFADVPSETPTIPSTPVTDDASAPWYEKVPLELDILLFDAAPATPTATDAGAFAPTHQTSTSFPVNLRAEPSTNADVVTVLSPATPLRWLGREEADESGTIWLEVELETGEAGWIREIDIGPMAEVPFEQTTCSPLTATPVPCGHAFQRHGPYWYNEFPAETDVIVRLHNIGTRTHRFVAAEFGIDVELGPADSADFVLDAPVGTYLFLIYEDGGTTPIGAGTFDFIEKGKRPSAG